MGDPPDLVLLEGYFRPASAGNSLSLQGLGSTRAKSDTDVGVDRLVRRCSVNGRMDFAMSDFSQHDADLVASFCISASNSALLFDQ